MLGVKKFIFSMMGSLATIRSDSKGRSTQDNLCDRVGVLPVYVIPFRVKNALVIFSRIVVATFKYFILKFLEVYFDD